MPTPFIGEIRITADSLIATGWALCNGQLLSIASNTTLFSILGTTYGGDGITTFALPDLRGRVPVGPGQGPGLSNRHRGDVGGQEAHTLSASEMPSHTHSLGAAMSNGNSDVPNGRVMARYPSAVPQYGTSGDVTLGVGAVGTAGGSQPHNNLQPYLVLNYIIALQGITPTHP